MNLEDLDSEEVDNPTIRSTYAELVQRLLYLEDRLQDHLDDHFRGDL